VKKTLSVLLIAAILGTLCALIIVPVGADGEENTTITTLVTLQPVTQPTTEPTIVTPEPTIVPTSAPTTIPTTVATTEPTIIITIPTVEPTAPGGGKGYIDTHCNVDGASVSFYGSYQCTIAQGVCTVGVSPTGTPIRTITVKIRLHHMVRPALPHALRRRTC